MKVFKTLNEIQMTEDTAVALGNFDGVHVGHRDLISHAVRNAHKAGLASAVFTFSNHPRNMFSEEKVKNILYPEDKEAVTEIHYEPWHLRYVGDPDIAREIMKKGITLEEYLGQVEPSDATVDYGTSALYTQQERKDAVSLLRAEFDTWPGCALHSVRYAGDACSTPENLEWMKSLGDGKNYAACIEFLTDFHSPAENSGALDPDAEYRDYQWWLARTFGGDWELLTCGY